jgi:transposase InsO family protein
MDDRIDVDDEEIAEALFRYRLIADALFAPRGTRAALLRAVAAEEHTRPDGASVHLTLRTLERWVERYEKDKLAGLLRQPRKDRGASRALSTAALARAIELRKEQPARSTATLIDILERAGEVAVGALRRSTLDRHLDKQGASRRLLHVHGDKRYVRLCFEHPLDFVVGDFHAGPYVRTETGDVRRTELGAFIDHCSRFVPEARYFLSEDLMSVRRGLRGLCTAWGVPRRLYVDNGPGYQAGRFHFACSELGIDLCHSRHYKSEGRGVIERFNRTVKEAFETEVRLRKEPPTHAELNAFWWAWLEERYHTRPHSETGEAPRERWQRLLKATEVRAVDPVLLDEVLRLHARRKVHAKTSTVEISGVHFVVDTSLRKRNVDVLFDPNDLSSVLVYYDGRRIQRAAPPRLGEPPEPSPDPKAPPPPSVDYLDLLRRSHEQRRAQELSSLRFTPKPNDAANITLTDLLARLKLCVKRPLGDVETSHAAEVLAALAPVAIALVDAALKTAVATLGHGLHASQYCHALRDHVLAARKQGAP